ncbi:MAG: DUF1573 domain-containing protein [Planctomycetota bacterium]|nr:DUF1573 domain-containing protein [Planctomycetota bacterium]
MSANALLALVAVGVLLLVIIYLFTTMNQDRPRRQTAPAERASLAPTSPASSIAPTIPPPAPLSAGDENDPVALVSILPEGFDFGVMKPGSLTRRTVELRNDSTSAIRILGTKRTCSCTTVEMNPGLLQPGASMPLTAIMAADLTPKDKNSVKVVVQYEDLAPTTISIKGVISQAVSSLPRDIRMHPRGYEEETYRTTGLLTLRSMDGQPFQVTRVAGEAPVFQSGAASMAPSISQIIRWDMSDYDQETGLDASGERIPFCLLVETDHLDAPVIAVPLNHKIDRIQPRGDRPWFFLDRRVVLDPVDSGRSVEFLLPVSGMSTASAEDVVDTVKADTTAFKAELVGFEPHVDGKRTNLRVRVTPSPDHRGVFMGRIQLMSSNHSVPFTVIGFAREPGAS